MNCVCVQPLRTRLDAVSFQSLSLTSGSCSMKRRGLVPFESAPALIHGYKLAFQLGEEQAKLAAAAEPNTRLDF